MMDIPNPFKKGDDDFREQLLNDPTIDINDLPRKRRRTKSATADEAPRDDAAVRTRRTASMEQSIGIFVSDINSLLLMLPWTHDDALTSIEETHLVKSWDSAQKVDKRLRTWTERITTTGGRVGLIGCVLGIVAARLIKHGIIPMPRLSEAQQAMMQEQAAKMRYAEQARQMGYESPESESPVTYITPDGVAYHTGVR